AGRCLTLTAVQANIFFNGEIHWRQWIESQAPLLSSCNVFGVIGWQAAGNCRQNKKINSSL
ncbi:MAG: hypothetical protein ACXWFI_13740, partial [Methylobacter sp.]